MDKITSYFFYGHEVSDYAKENKRVDYATLAKSFDCVLNNDIIANTSSIGEWESENEYYFMDVDGNEYTSSEAEEMKENLENEIEELENSITDENESEINEKIDNIRENLEALDEYHYHEIFQYYIVSDNGAEILRQAGEILFYNRELDMYVWGVDHWGTAWTHVLTNIEIDIKEK